MASDAPRRAQTAVEFALILPIFMLVLVGTMEWGRVFFAYGQLLQAAQDGVRYGAVLRKNDEEIRTRVQQASPGGPADTVTVSATASPTDSTPVAAADRTRGNVLRVSVHHDHSVLMPLFPLSAVSLTANASLVIE
jgi:Flp pilus assembly protein TadG